MAQEDSYHKFDVAIVGGGILGVTSAFWLSELFECSIVLIDKEQQVALHTSSRNTGMVHRPFYLNPEKKRVFARASQKSYFMWKDLALKSDLTWKPIGTLEVAIEEEQTKILDQYGKWALENGMKEEEFEILDFPDVKKLEPEVRCAGAFYSKTDTCVNYKEMVEFVFEKCLKNRVKFVSSKVKKVQEKDGKVKLELLPYGNVEANFMINAAGGGSIDIAHALSLAKEYTDLHFRGEYWKVDEPYASKISRNVYSVPKFKEFPFLDPHLIVRANGMREIGPNAVLVFGPGAYKGLSENKTQIISKIFERPIGPKLKLFVNTSFLSLVSHEWKSSVSKSAMCSRVKEFIPAIDPSFLNSRGLAGVRSSVIDGKGFVPEAVLVNGENSIHILNYNSPGATGAPAFSAYVISKIMRDGHFEFKRKNKASFWNYEEASDL